jgi:hypothetical protein
MLDCMDAQTVEETEEGAREHVFSQWEKKWNKLQRQHLKVFNGVRVLCICEDWQAHCRCDMVYHRVRCASLGRPKKRHNRNPTGSVSYDEDMGDDDEHDIAQVIHNENALLNETEINKRKNEIEQKKTESLLTPSKESSLTESKEILQDGKSIPNPLVESYKRAQLAKAYGDQDIGPSDRIPPPVHPMNVCPRQRHDSCSGSNHSDTEPSRAKRRLRRCSMDSTCTVDGHSIQGISGEESGPDFDHPDSRRDPTLHLPATFVASQWETNGDTSYSEGETIYKERLVKKKTRGGIFKYLPSLIADSDSEDEWPPCKDALPPEPHTHVPEPITRDRTSKGDRPFRGKRARPPSPPQDRPPSQKDEPKIRYVRSRFGNVQVPTRSTHSRVRSVREQRAWKTEAYAVTDEWRDKIVQFAGFWPDRDAFAQKCNARFKYFWEDAFKEDWSEERLWINAPFSKYNEVLEKVYRDQASGIMIVPVWKDQKWWHMLSKIAVTWWDIPDDVALYQSNGGLKFEQQRQWTTRAVVFDAYQAPSHEPGFLHKWDTVETCPNATHKANRKNISKIKIPLL